MHAYVYLCRPLVYMGSAHVIHTCTHVCMYHMSLYVYSSEHALYIGYIHLNIKYTMPKTPLVMPQRQTQRWIQFALHDYMI